MRWKVAIAILVPAIGFFTYDYLMGRHIVKGLCAKDGGLKIHERQYAPGLLDGFVEDEKYCSACFDRLAKHKFEYVDIRVHGDPRTASSLAILPGYYRLSLAPSGDARCSVWSRNVSMVEWRRLQHNVGIPDSQCVAVTLLPELPEEAVLMRERGGIPNNKGISISYDVWALRTTRSHRTLAELREYASFVRWGLIFDWAPVEPSARCMTPEAKVAAMTSFETQVLRDPSKKPNQSDSRTPL